MSLIVNNGNLELIPYSNNRYRLAICSRGKNRLVLELYLELISGLQFIKKMSFRVPDPDKVRETRSSKHQRASQAITSNRSNRKSGRSMLKRIDIRD
jgi:hypothetical protein